MMQHGNQTNTRSPRARKGGEEMAEGHDRPGVMLYFEVGQVMRNMSYANMGRMVEAILDYAEFGTVPTLRGQLKTFWPVVQDKIDRDYACYKRVINGKKRAVNIRWWKRYAQQNGLDPNDEQARDKWLRERMELEEAEEAEEQEQDGKGEDTENTAVQVRIRKIPTPSPTPSPTRNPSLSPYGDGTPWPSVAAAPPVPVPACAGETPTPTQTEKEWYGEYRNVRLSPSEVTALRRELGDGWESVVNRLSEYMRMHGKTYTDHFAAVRSFAKNNRRPLEKERETLGQSSDRYSDCFPGSAL